MSYRVEFTRSALKTFDLLPKRDQRRVSAVLDVLEEDPRPQGSRKISGSEDLFRVRVGDYRVIYRIEGETLIVLIVKIGHRRDVYRGL